MCDHGAKLLVAGYFQARKNRGAENLGFYHGKEKSGAVAVRCKMLLVFKTPL
jgi:hypothetical protein